MKSILNKLWKFLNSRIALYIGIVVAVVLFAGTCSRNGDLRDELDRKDQNISALSDSIRTVKLKNGDLQSSRDAFMATANELKLLNAGLSDEVKLQKGRVVTLNRIVFQLKQDTADLQKYIDELLAKYEKPEKVNDSTYNFPWTLPFIYDSTNYDIFSGKTQVGLRGKFDPKEIILNHNKTWLVERNSQIGLTWGQKWEGTGKNKRLKVYAQTAHPAFSTKLLEGTYVDYPKKKHWFTGFGVGPQFGVGYDPFVQKPSFYLGLGIHYNIYQF